MTNLMIRIVTLATCSIALSAAFSFDPVVAAEGGGGRGDGWAWLWPDGTTLRLSAFVLPEAVGFQGHSRPEAKKANQSLSTTPLWRTGGTSGQGSDLNYSDRLCHRR